MKSFIGFLLIGLLLLITQIYFEERERNPPCNLRIVSPDIFSEVSLIYVLLLLYLSGTILIVYGIFLLSQLPTLLL